MSEKLQKVLARAGKGSRRAIETLIAEGRVSVDGNVSILGDRVKVIGTTQIGVDGRIISIPLASDDSCRVLAYYKPEGELCCALRDSKRRPTVFERLPRLKSARWVAVGRLDINTSGLLLFTTDGELAYRLMRPSFAIEREYAVRVFGLVDEEKLRQLIRGIPLKDGQAAFRSLKFKGGEGRNQWYHVTLTEGRNREVRRLWAAAGAQVSRLIRVRYGSVILPRGMSRGCWTELSLENTNALREKVQLPLTSFSKRLVQQDNLRTKTVKAQRTVNSIQKRTQSRRGQRIHKINHDLR
ncbi:23S rRNA pseudouridine(2605) synthase RluB [secondary endosymbiont of Ctenarytaina eucalypti]|uniref:Pseudouridine synthase n=1 Tax=secondary endosymbiont of Ctenarytaina eucalypti TaxID=1199245 RepID=J3TEW3_9ENTR|nr:23S rRNA pseudouridine(2605) synthase RluB [secondary endosymbiont of Ctenarytaina eucalypti]AFP84447.1 pseudouridine synthase family protein [secondary endosymbiont of Ctenarytaina eucalypti]